MFLQRAKLLHMPVCSCSLADVLYLRTDLIMCCIGMQRAAIPVYGLRRIPGIPFGQICRQGHLHASMTHDVCFCGADCRSSNSSCDAMQDLQGC